MARRDITDAQVVAACRDVRRFPSYTWDAPALLHARTGQGGKVIMRAMERAERRGLIEYGTSLRTAWPTEKGMALLDADDGDRDRTGGA